MRSMRNPQFLPLIPSVPGYPLSQIPNTAPEKPDFRRRSSFPAVGGPLFSLSAIVEILKSLPVEETLLIGCEPDPWARALSRFLRHGWKLKQVGALDFSRKRIMWKRWRC